MPDIEKINVSAESRSKLQNEYEVVKRVLDSLGPKHKIIYLTYKGYEYYTKQGYKLPRKLLESLREELLKIKFVGTDMSFQKFKEDVKEEIFKCQLEPGIPIGDLRGKPVFQGR